MSTHPEEIEEGEIVSDVEDELSMSEGDMEVLDEDEEDEEEGIDIADLMGSLLATPDGDTVCTALVGISQQIEIQNKILVKILSRLSQKSA
jgi:DNA-binding IscR family transcriptional regulator